MDAFALRLAADRERLDALAAASAGRIAVVAAPAAHSPRLELLLRYPTAAGPDYPVRRSEESRLAVTLGDRYPFQPPVATFLTPVFHPNVFASGVVCLGTKWLPSEGMDLFLQRVIRLMTFDPLLVNIHSAAHPRALHWYVQARAAHPGAFPSERVDFGSDTSNKRVRWGAQDDARAVVPCPACRIGLRLPAGRRGTVLCPRCGHGFEAST